MRAIVMEKGPRMLVGCHIYSLRGLVVDLLRLEYKAVTKVCY